MNKYLQLFKVSFEDDFAYKTSFVMWRLRNVLQIFLVFFLWDAVFSTPGKIVFGYDRAKMLTYVFGLVLIRAFVLSAKATEVSGEIARGELSNYLLRPIAYFKYWLTRDIASKVLNLGFAVVEAFLLYLLLKPPFFVQTNPLAILGFLLLALLGMFIYFVLSFLVSTVPFWLPEAGWGAHFLVTAVAVQFLSGGMFPLDVLPDNILKVLNLTPFPYLIFFPLEVYLGKVSGMKLLGGLAVALLWAVGLWFILQKVWAAGLKRYESHGQ